MEKLFEKIRNGELGEEWSGPLETADKAKKNIRYWIVVPTPKKSRKETEKR